MVLFEDCMTDCPTGGCYLRHDGLASGDHQWKVGGAVRLVTSVQDVKESSLTSLASLCHVKDLLK